MQLVCVYIPSREKGCGDNCALDLGLLVNVPKQQKWHNYREMRDCVYVFVRECVCVREQENERA